MTREQWIEERIAQAQEDEADEFVRQVNEFEEENRRKDDKAKMDMTRNCPRPIKKIRGPLFDNKPKEMF